MKGLVRRLKGVESPAVREVLLATRGFLHWLVRGHAVRHRVLRGYLDETAEPKLHLGSGSIRLEGWLNADLIAGDVHLNLKRRLPVPDGTFAYVFGEHVIEHLSEAAGQRLLREVRRVLRPGGVLRLTTPDLRKLIDIYEDRSPVVDRDAFGAYLSEITDRPIGRPAQILNAELRLWGHRHIYDQDDLTARLREAGFTSVERCDAGISAHPQLHGLERHGSGPWVNEAEAMSLEATY
ncbi:MAG: class I SAM-dependent methyltransferase [Acidimicrobiia bacterium]